MKKKVLLMGASGSGKTSMRSLIFSNHPASLTSRLGATIDVEQNHVRFLGDLVLNLWDCGGQDGFMDSYLSVQQQTIFSHVGVLIYVFDVTLLSPAPAAAPAREGAPDGLGKHLTYFHESLDALRRFSPEAAVFLLVHKLDLVRGDKQAALERYKAQLTQQRTDTLLSVFGTSIYDESLYRAWSQIVHTLIPNAAVLSKHLATFASACSATEVILFERTTFLVIATSNPPSSDPSGASAEDEHRLDPTRYERTSELIKAFKHSCARLRDEFRTLEIDLPEFTAVLDELTKNMYVLVVVHDPTIETAALKMNIRLARKKFEELQGDSLV